MNCCDSLPSRPLAAAYTACDTLRGTMQRLVTGLVLTLCLVGCLFFLGPEAWLVLVAVMAVLCAVELGRLLAKAYPGSPSYAMPPLVLATMSIMVYGERLLGDGPLAGSEITLLAVAVVVLPAIVALLHGRPQMAWPAVPWLSFGALYCAVPAVATITLREDSGPWVVVLLLGIVGLGDSAAFYCGKTWGVRKLAPALSPKKTWVGSIGGVTAAVLVGVLWSWFRLDRIDLWLLLVAAVTQAVGQCGDLLESAIKRVSGVKDSGTLLPGHGGLLDRADATLLAAPVFVIGVRLFGEGWS